MDFTTNTKVGVSEKPTVKYEVVKEALFTSGSPTISLMDRGTSSLPSILSVSDSSDRDICRICHCEGDVNMPLIAPCPCSGSLRFVHQACLQQWIKSSNTRCCELCKFEFIIEAKVKPFRKWEKLRISPVERRKILCSITFHAIAITCVVWSLYVLLDRTAEEMKSGALEWPFWTKLLVVVIGFTGGVLFMYVQCKMYAQLFRRWRSYNRVIFVRNAPEKQIVSADVLSLKGEDVESTAMIDDDHSKELSVVDEFHSCDSGSSSTLTVDEREKLENECNNDVTSNVSTKDEDPLIVTVVADGNESGSTWRDEDKEILEPPTTKTVVEKQVKCYTCEVDFTKETFTMENTCVKPPESRIPITCSPNYKFCQVNLTVNEYYIILAFQRNCVEECEESCVVARGTEKSTCISCCNNNPSCGL